MFFVAITFQPITEVNSALLHMNLHSRKNLKKIYFKYQQVHVKKSHVDNITVT